MDFHIALGVSRREFVNRDFVTFDIATTCVSRFYFASFWTCFGEHFRVSEPMFRGSQNLQRAKH